MTVLTWEEIEAAQSEISNRMKKIESELIQEDLPEEVLVNLTEQLFAIQKIVSDYNDKKDEILKDKI